jgi:hypothetical protein
LREGRNQSFICAGERELRLASSLSMAERSAGKFEIVVDHLAQQAGQKAERKLLERVQVSDDQLPCLGRIRRELFGF